jgi:hypothetical protein
MSRHDTACTTEEGLVLEIHSHRGGAARFSETDDVDEQRLRLYGVVGKLDDLRPAVNLRAGAYGHFLPVPWSAVLAGDASLVNHIVAEVTGVGSLMCMLPSLSAICRSWSAERRVKRRRIGVEARR